MTDASNFKLIIEDDEGRRSVVPVDLGEVSIGRLDGNTIRLNERNVSRRHARLFKETTEIVAEDLDSYNGVFINGDRIKGRHEVMDGDLIRIGDFQLELRGEGLQRRTEETTQRTLMPDTEATMPEIRMDGAPPPAALKKAPEPEPEPEPEERHEPTAIIRMDHFEDVEASRKQNRALAGQKAKLICVSTQFAGKELEISKSEMVIGRTDENDFAIDHRSVSRHHAKITVAGRSYKIVDLKSANGTLVNGEEYAQADLKSGDLVELGHVKFRFVPPGEHYSFTAEELAAVNARGDVDSSEPAPRAARVSEHSAREVVHSNRVLLAAIGGLAVVIVGMLIWMATGGEDRPQVVEVSSGNPVVAAPAILPTATPGVAVTPVDSGADGLVQKANQAMLQRQWPQAVALGRAALALSPGDAAAQEVVGKAEVEAAGQLHYDTAVAAINDNDWSQAWNHLQEIPAGSSYQVQGSALMSQVRGALVTERVAEADEALERHDWAAAQSKADEIESLDASRPELIRIRNAAEEGRRRKSAASSARSARAKTARAKGGQKQAKAPPQNGGSSSPKAAGGNAKASYDDGRRALSGGDFQKAITHFTKCIGADKRMALCYRALGIAYAKAGNGPKAYRYYKQYVKLNPNAADAPQVRKLLQQYEQAQ